MTRATSSGDEPRRSRGQPRPITGPRPTLLPDPQAGGRNGAVDPARRRHDLRDRRRRPAALARHRRRPVQRPGRTITVLPPGRRGTGLGQLPRHRVARPQPPDRQLHVRHQDRHGRHPLHRQPARRPADDRELPLARLPLRHQGRPARPRLGVPPQPHQHQHQQGPGRPADHGRPLRPGLRLLLARAQPRRAVGHVARLRPRQVHRDDRRPRRLRRPHAHRPAHRPRPRRHRRQGRQLGRRRRPRSRLRRRRRRPTRQPRPGAGGRTRPRRPGDLRHHRAPAVVRARVRGRQLLFEQAADGREVLRRRRRVQGQRSRGAHSRRPLAAVSRERQGAQQALRGVEGRRGHRDPAEGRDDARTVDREAAGSPRHHHRRRCSARCCCSAGSRSG